MYIQIKNIEIMDEELNEILDNFYNCFKTGYDFEDFLKIYLEAIGVDEIEVTQRSRDGGIDLKGIRKGIDDLTDLDSVKYYIQAKRYKPKSSVPINDVRALRGVMDDGFKGLFITTGKFSKESYCFAKSSSSRPIILIDGKKLIQSCIDKGIGFKTKPIFDRHLLRNLLNKEKIDKEKKEKAIDFNSSIKKKITQNDIRTRILPIPSAILEKLPEDKYDVLFQDDEKLNLKINRERKYFGGVTKIYKKYELLIEDNIPNPKDSYWLIDEKNKLIKIFFQENS